MLPSAQAEESWGVLGVAIAAAVLSCFAYRASGESRIPRWVVYVGIAAAVGYVMWEMFAPHEEQTVYILDLAHFMILLCCCKFFEFRRYRDMGVVVLVSYLLLVISAFVSASLLFGMVLIVDLTFGIAWLWAFQGKCEFEAILHRSLARGAAIDVPAEGRSERRPRPSLVSTTAAHSTVLMVIAVSVFVLVPRGWGYGLFGGMHRLIPTALTGLNEEVKLRNAPIMEDESVVLRARFIRNGELITGEEFRPHLRGLTFDRYHSGRWQRTPAASEIVFPAGSPQAPMPLAGTSTIPREEGITEQQVWLDDVRDGTLFSIYPPLAFGSADVDRVFLDRKDLALHIRTPSGGGIHYAVRSLPSGPSALQHSLEFRPTVPRDGPSSIPARVTDFARELVAQYGDPNDPAQHGRIAQRICEYLCSGQFAYTLDRGPSGDESDDEPGDPVCNFLFVNRRGHCEYFASAMTVLCQAVGIRARLVGGYYGGEFNDVGAFYQFRRKDAHAWVEVFQPNVGWVTLDPSPIAATRTRARDADLGARLRQMLELVQFRWSLFVVSFDKESRQELADHVQSWLRTFVAEEGGTKSFWSTMRSLMWGPEVLPLWQRLLYWLLLVLCTTLALLVLRILWILSLMLRERMPRRNHHGRVLVRRAEAKFYDRVLLLLANKGHVKPAHSTPREFAQTLARRHPDLKPVVEITEWFYEAQYGHQELSPDGRNCLGPFLQRLREDSTFGAA